GVGGNRWRRAGAAPRRRRRAAARRPGRPSGAGCALVRVSRLPTRRTTGAGGLAQRSAAMKTIVIGASGLRPADVRAVARGGARVALDPAAVHGMAASLAIVEKIEQDQGAVYGTSTGF